MINYQWGCRVSKINVDNGDCRVSSCGEIWNFVRKMLSFIQSLQDRDKIIIT